MSRALAQLDPTASPTLAGWSLLQRAQGFLQKWPEGFRGYRAGVRVHTEDVKAEGGVVVASGQEPVVDLEPRDLRELVRAWLLEHVDERTPRFFKDGDGRFVVRREATIDGTVSVRVERPDACVRYELDPRGRISVVERRDPERVTLTVIEEYSRATPGRVLPARRRTSVHEVATGRCVGRQQLQESHCRIEHVWLPTTRDLVTETPRGALVYRVELFAHQLL